MRLFTAHWVSSRWLLLIKGAKIARRRKTTFSLGSMLPTSQQTSSCTSGPRRFYSRKQAQKRICCCNSRKPELHSCTGPFAASEHRMPSQRRSIKWRRRQVMLETEAENAAVEDSREDSSLQAHFYYFLSYGVLPFMYLLLLSIM